MGLKFQSGDQYYMKCRIGYANPHFASKDSELNFYTVRLNLFDLGEELSLQRLLARMIFDWIEFSNKV